MLFKLKKYWFILLGLLILIGLNFAFIYAIKESNKYTPVKPEVVKPDPVDYQIDKNRLQCILRRTDPEIINLCTDAFK